MTYRPQNQSIEGPATTIVAAIKDFEDAVEERAMDGEWKSSHLDEIIDMAADLGSLKHRLIRLARETW
jgi:hypothetical protein